MNDKRRLTRRRLAVYFDVIERGSGIVLGKLADLTPTGIMLVSSQPIETNVTFHLRILLPEGLARKDAIEFEARSVWCKSDTNPQLHTTGFEFVKLSEQDIRIISRLIFDYGLQV